MDQFSGVRSQGPRVIHQTIDISGQFLVPEEMQPGQWAYTARTEGGSCWIDTYSDLSGSDDSRLDYYFADNKGFFVLNKNVRMVNIFEHGDGCIYTRIGEGIILNL